MVSVHASGVFHIPRLVTWLARDPESLSSIDNEIWLEKIQSDFSPEGNLLKELNYAENDFVRR
jgi:hypothetical protein